MTNPNGRFGVHGGQYIPETLMNAVIELEEAYNYYKKDPAFNRELTELFNEYAGRPSRLYYAKRMTKDLGGAKIYLKREDLNHTGAHKINNVLGQALLAKKMGKTRLIAETGAGQHGVASATAAALLDMECVVFMGEEDTIRQAQYVPVTDDEAVEAFEYLARTEGIIPAIESAHAVAHARKLAPTMGKDQSIVITISGRGDKDCAAIARYKGEDLHE